MIIEHTKEQLCIEVSNLPQQELLNRILDQLPSGPDGHIMSERNDVYYQARGTTIWNELIRVLLLHFK